MQNRPVQTDFYKWGGLVAVVAGAIGIVFNVLHPRSTGDVANVQGHLQTVADSGIWRLDHIALGLAVALGLVGVIAIALSMTATAGDAWARAWLIFAAVASAVLLVLLALDGTAMKALADGWAASPNDATFAAAAALTEITVALLGASIALYFGISPLLFAMAVMRSGTYPKAMAQAAMVAGGLGLLAALLMALQGLTTLNITYLFPISSLLGTVVLIWAGWELWKRHESFGTSSGAVPATKTDASVTPGV